MGSVKITGIDMIVFVILLWQETKIPTSYKQILESTQQKYLLKTVPQPSVRGIHRLIWE